MGTLTRKRSYKRIYLVLGSMILLFSILQLFNKPIAARPVTGKIDLPKEVMVILKRSCFDCHSNEQNLKWYDQVAPLAWVAKKDVDRARKVLNFSELGQLSAAEHKGKMYAILNMMQAGKMPLPSYTVLHPSAKISQADIQIVKNYTLSLSGDLPTKVSPEKPFVVQSQMAGNIPDTFPISPNGVKYTDAFKKWKVVSMSTLFDNSIRVIFGNSIAVGAIETENLHPWPDGSIIVKAVWEQTANENGDIRAGKFINAQFMEKNSHRYKNTEGWGFAKFSGNKLIPTGKTAGFAKQSCISCHRQLAESTGYLFDVPLKINPEDLILKSK